MGGICQYEGVMVSVIGWVTVLSAEECKELYTSQGFEEDEGWNADERDRQLWRWMGQKIRWAGVESIRICKIFTVMAGTE